ncbi:DUF2567 domain-containing protein [Jatrophihabitans endophyticus]|uniref:DUF2567 domain-containing protein n=1 Tax=Jatrophihabitans endophyticus TaxID=1206085 RepID=UPI0019E3CED9|nr:DUF2567 domain-containing protein [Jatrophihabitans endophyticus]MBE7186959.1 DUF2567 domain-containing protein [Jatrophihabitans endophyticus]
MTAPVAGVEDDRTEPGRAQESVYGDLRQALRTVLALSAIGAILGLVWAAWSPPGPQAQVLGGGKFIADETESFIAGDGRFLVLALIVGVVAAVLAWTDRAHRGPIVLGGLIVGGLTGSLLMELVGHLTGGGSFHGAQLPGTDYVITSRLPLSLHIQGLLLIESAVAALVYGLLVAFAAADDLGRPDPVHDALRPPGWAGPAPSVDAGGQPQDGGGHGDAAGPLQQGYFAPQEPGDPQQPGR